MLLDGRSVALDIKTTVQLEVSMLKAKHGKVPVLASVCVGDNPASQVYMRSQAKLAENIGIEYRIVSLPGDIDDGNFLMQLRKLEEDQNIHGVILQRPLPEALAGIFVYPQKDVEGMNPCNLGRLFSGEGKIVPPTVEACMELLHYYKIKLYGKEAVVVGHSEIVGKPLSMLLLKEFATTTVCHVATWEAKQLINHVKRAEILIVAVGKANLIKGDWIKEGAVVIDVGINKLGDKIVGDVEFTSAEARASYITPVPGGVGPLTVALLMKNCVKLFKESLKS
jgi:methylenetetrahydrofolate dehydrogenase (NADP+)/methenyltetrahydrofolate cyclohydrolase